MSRYLGNEDAVSLVPFHFSTMVHNQEDTRWFYTSVLGCEERRCTKTSIHFDFFGTQLTLHHVEDHKPAIAYRMIDGAMLPLPHCGSYISSSAYAALKTRLDRGNVSFNEVRFSHGGLAAIFADPSGNAIVAYHDESADQAPLHSLTPFLLALQVGNLQQTKDYYGKMLELPLLDSGDDFVSYSLAGSVVQFYETEGYNAKNILREVDAEDVPVPHFGAALSVEDFKFYDERMVSENYPFVLNSHVRFVSKAWEQWVLFVLDPMGHAIELKSFTKAQLGRWA